MTTTLPPQLGGAGGNGVERGRVMGGGQGNDDNQADVGSNDKPSSFQTTWHCKGAKPGQEGDVFLRVGLRYPFF